MQVAIAWTNGPAIPTRIDGYAYLNGQEANDTEVGLWSINSITSTDEQYYSVTSMSNINYFMELNAEYDDYDTLSVDEGVTYDDVGENVTFTVGGFPVTGIVWDEIMGPPPSGLEYGNGTNGSKAWVTINNQYSGDTLYFYLFSDQVEDLWITLNSPTPEDKNLYLDTIPINLMFNVSCDSNSLDQVQLTWDGVNESFSSHTGNTYTKIKTGIIGGNHTFFAWCNNTYGQMARTETRTIYVDVADPILNLTSPANDSVFHTPHVNVSCNAVDDFSIVFMQVNVSDGEKYNLYNDVDMYEANYTLFVEFLSLPNGHYEWSCSAADYYALYYSDRGFVESQYYDFTVDVDYSPPDVTLVSPPSNYLSEDTSHEFVCNVSSSTELENITLYTNLSGVWSPYGTKNLSGSEGIVTWNITDILPGTYEWNCRAFNQYNSSYGQENRIFTVQETIIKNFSVQLISPVDNAYEHLDQNTFSCQALSPNNLTQVDLYMNRSGVWQVVNSTVVNENNATVSWVMGGLDDGVYSWNCLAVDAVKSLFFWKNYTLRIEGGVPCPAASRNGWAVNMSHDFVSAQTAYLHVKNLDKGTDYYSTDPDQIYMSVDLFTIAFGNVGVNDNGNCYSSTDTIRIDGYENMSGYRKSFRYEGSSNPTDGLKLVSNEIPWVDTVSLNRTLVGEYDVVSCDYNGYHDVFTPKLDDNMQNYTQTTPQTVFYRWFVDGVLVAERVNKSSFLLNELVNPPESGTLSCALLVNDGIDNATDWVTSSGISITSSPDVFLMSPQDSYTSKLYNISFDYEVVDSVPISMCSLFLDGVVENVTLNPQRSIGLSFKNMVGSGSHTWHVECLNENGIRGKSDVRNISVEPQHLLQLLSPDDRTTVGSRDVTFKCYVNESGELASVSLWTNHTGQWRQIETKTPENPSIVSFTVDNFTSGTYLWNCQMENSLGETFFAPINYTFALSSQGEVSLNSPENQPFPSINSTSIEMNCSANDPFGLDRIELWNNFDGEWKPVYNESFGGTHGSIYVNVSTPASGYYEWNCRALNGDGVDYFAEMNYSFSVIKLLRIPRAVIKDSTFTFSGVKKVIIKQNQSWVFDGTDSYDPDGEIINYIWYWDYENNRSKISVGDVVNVSFFEEGRYVGVLEVVDNDGLLAIESFVLAVSPPEGFRPVADLEPVREDTFVYSFNTNKSVAPENFINLYVLDFGDGTKENKTTNEPFFKLYEPVCGKRNVTLSVRNALDLWDNVTEIINICNVSDEKYVDYVYPEHRQNVDEANITFICRANSDVPIVNVTFWNNLKGPLLPVETTAVEGEVYRYDAEFYVSDIVEGQHMWECSFYGIDGEMHEGELIKFNRVAMVESPVADVTEDSIFNYLGRIHVMSINNVSSFNASPSYDPDGEIKEYSWYWDWPNMNDVSKGMVVQHSYDAIGNHTVMLQVEDYDGMKANFSFRVFITDGVTKFPPWAIIKYEKIVVDNKDNLVLFDGAESMDIDGGNLQLKTWDFGDSGVARGLILNHTYMECNQSNYNVTLTVMDDEGEMNQANVTVKLCYYPTSVSLRNYLERPSMKLSDFVMFEATSSSWPWKSIANYTYQFTRKDDNSSFNITKVDDIYVHQFNQCGTYDIYLYATDTDGLWTRTENKQTIDVCPKPYIDFKHVKGSNLGEQIQFESLSKPAEGGEGLSYHIWDFGDGTTQAVSMPSMTISHVYNSCGTYAVNLTVNTTVGRWESTVKNVTICHEPVAVISRPIDIQVAKDDPVQFSGEQSYDLDEGGYITNFYWDFNDSTASLNSLDYHSFDKCGDYNISLRVVDDSGMEDTVWKLIDVCPSPVALINRSVYYANVMEGVEFDGSSSFSPAGYDIVQYEWSYGDGDTGLGAISIHSYPQCGNYSVGLNVIDEMGEYSNASADVIVCPNPVAVILPNTTVMEATRFMNYVFNGSLSYGPSGKAIVDYQWDFGDGATSSEPVIAHNFSACGIYNVKLTVTDEIGRNNTAVRVVNVCVPPVANFERYPSRTDQNRPYTFNASGSYAKGNATIRYYKWDFGDGVITDWDANPMVVHNYTGCAYYYPRVVKLSVRDSNDVISETKQNVYVCDYPYARYFWTPGSQYIGQPVIFNASDSFDSSTGVATYYWDFGDGTRITTPNSTVNHTYDRFGGTNGFPIYLQVYDEEGNSKYPESVDRDRRIYIKAGTNAVFYVGTVLKSPFFMDDINTPLSFDASQSTVSEGLSISNARFTWDFGDGSIQTNVGMSGEMHSYSECGTYNVTLTLTDVMNVSDTYTREISICPKPVADIDVSTMYGKPGSLIFFSGINSYNYLDLPIVKYSWDFDDGITGSGPTIGHSFSECGKYDVNLTVTDYRGMNGSDTVMIDICPKPVVEVDIDPQQANVDYDILFNGSRSYDLSGAELVGYEWDFGDGTSATGKEVYHSYTTCGTKTVSLNVTSSTGSSSVKNSEVEVCPKPVVNVVTNRSSVDTGVVFLFNASGSYSPAPNTSIVSYKINWGDGTDTTSLTGVASYSYASCVAGVAKSVTISVTVYDENGQSNTGYTSMQLCDYPQARITNVVPTHLNRYESVILNASTSSDDGSYIAHYLWSGLDQSYDDTKSFINTTFDTCSPDGRDIYLDVQDANGRSSRYHPNVKIYVCGDEPVANFTVSNNTAEYQEEIFFNGSMSKDVGRLTTNIIYYAWDFGDGTKLEGPDLKTVAHGFNTCGIIDVSLTVTDEDLMKNTMTKQVSICYMPTASIWVSTKNVSIGQPLRFYGVNSTDTNGGWIEDYEWDFGDGTISNERDPIHRFQTCGIKTVMLTVYDNSNFTDTDEVTINVCNVPYADAGDSDFAVVGLPQQFDGSRSFGIPPSIIVNYSWDFGDGTTESGTDLVNPIHTYENVGDYYAVLTVYDNFGYYSNDTVLILVGNEYTNLSKPHAEFDFVPKTIYTGTMVAFDGSYTQDDGVVVEYDWTFGDGSYGSNVLAFHKYDLSGVYTVSLKVTDDDNLTDTIEKDVIVLDKNVTLEANLGELILPEGVYSIRPSILPSAGSYLYEVPLRFENTTATAGTIVGCYVNQSNCYDSQLSGCNRVFLGHTLTDNLDVGPINFTYPLSANDSVSTTNGGTTSLWIPWRITECGIYDSAMNPLDVIPVKWNIHVHGIEWTAGDIANAVNAKTLENQYLFNSIKADNQGDVAFAVAKYGGATVEEYCHDGVDSSMGTVGFEEADDLVDCSDPDCAGITYTCLAKQSFDNPDTWYSPSGSHGTLAIDIPLGDIFSSSTTSTTFNTNIDYTMHTMPNGTFKIRFRKWGLSKISTIIVEGLPDIKRVNKYAPAVSPNLGLMEYFLDNTDSPIKTDVLDTSQTYTNKIVVKSFDDQQEIENLDTVLNVSFSDPSSIDMSEGYVLRLTFNYVEGSQIFEEKKNITIYFDSPDYVPTDGDTRPRWNSDNQRENEIWLDDPSVGWTPCGDGKNGDFDYINCDTNEQNCFDQSSYDCYDVDCDGEQGPFAWNDYLKISTTGRCAYTDEGQLAEYCFDNYNNDWATEDITLGDQNTGLKLIDCRDSGCAGIVNPGNSSEVCEYNREVTCDDGFDNDLYNALDCEIIDDSSWDVDDAEYDCAEFCRAIVLDTETGELCDDGLDNDWDAYVMSGTNGYAVDNVFGAGIDCNYGTAADEDCNNTVMSNGKRCELGTELTCDDGFDNDYDNGFEVSAGWKQTEYEIYFGYNYAPGADCDDYDCATVCSISSESLNASWCFDGVDNDLDAYYKIGGNLELNISTGIDCADPDCLGVVNPNDATEQCLPQEFNLSMGIQYCADAKDNDYSLTDNVVELYGYSIDHADSEDLDCWRQFGYCGPSPTFENITWDSCADGEDNDFDDGYNFNSSGWKYDGTDCADVDCVGELGDYDGHVCVSLGMENTVVLCSDEFDNDANGLVDCSDSGCYGVGYCDSGIESRCDDDIDNDGDSLMDCADPDCGCDINSNMAGGYYPPTTTSRTFAGVQVTWDSRVRIHDDYTVRLKYSQLYDSANLYVGNLQDGKHGLPVGTGLNAPSFSLGGVDAGVFETTSYAENSENTRGQIALLDQDHSGTNRNGFDVTLRVPTSATLGYHTFEYFHAISGQTTNDNMLSVIVLDDIKPVVENVLVEPTVRSSIPYSGGVWFGAKAVDEEHGDYQDGTIYRCYYNLTGPEYFKSGYTDTCKATLDAFKQDGQYILNVWAVDNTGNIGDVYSTQFSVGLKPIYVEDSFTIDPTFYRSGDVVNISATFKSDDVITGCAVYYKDSTGAVTDVGTISAEKTGDEILCRGTILAPSQDEMYRVWINLSDAEGDSAVSDVEVMYVCNSLESEGQGWTCAKADFDDDGVTEGIITTLYGTAQACDMCVGVQNTGLDDDADGIDNVCDTGNISLMVTLVSPAHDSVVENATFTCAVNSTENVSNVTLYLNVTGVWGAYETQTVSSKQATVQWDVLNLTNGAYSWNCLAVTENGLMAYATTNYTVFVNETVDESVPNVTLISPADDTVLNVSSVMFECGVDSLTELINVSLWTNVSGDWEITLYLNVSGSGNYLFNVSGLDNGVYGWTCEAYNAHGRGVGDNRTFIRQGTETVSVDVTLVSPAHDSVVENATFTCAVNSTENVSNVTLYLNVTGEWGAYETQTVSSKQATVQWDVLNLTNGAYSWNCLATTVNGLRTSAPANWTVYLNGTQEGTGLVVNLRSPVDGYKTDETNITFICGVEYGEDLLNVSLLTNLTGTWGVLDYVNTSLAGNYSFNAVLPFGQYAWNCRAVSAIGTEAVAMSNYTLSVGAPILPEVILIDPNDGLVINENDLSVRCNVSSDRLLTRVALWSNISGTWSEVDSASVTGNVRSGTWVWNLSSLNEGTYSWNCKAEDELYSSFSETNFSFVVVLPNRSAPDVILVSPFDNAVIDKRNITVNCNVTSPSTIVNVTLWGNMSGEWGSVSTYEMSDSLRFGSWSWNITDLVPGVYAWNCHVANVYNDSSANHSSVFTVIDSINKSLASIKLVEPLNGMKLLQNDITMTCDVTSPSNLLNVSLLGRKVPGEWEMIHTENVTGTNASVSVVLNQEDGIYEWTCKVFNEYSVSITDPLTYEVNASVTDDTYPEIINQMPLNGSSTFDKNITLSCGAQDDMMLYSITAYVNSSGYESAHRTVVYNESWNAIWNVSVDNGIIAWYCEACDWAGNCNRSNTNYVDVKQAALNITLISPTDDYTFETEESNIQFSYNVSGTSGDAAVCRVMVNDTEIYMTSSVGVYTVEKTLGKGIYDWRVECVVGGHNFVSETRTLTIGQKSSGGGGHGGGSGYGYISPNAEEPVLVLSIEGDCMEDGYTLNVLDPRTEEDVDDFNVRVGRISSLNDTILEYEGASSPYFFRVYDEGIYFVYVSKDGYKDLFKRHTAVKCSKSEVSGEDSTQTVPDEPVVTFGEVMNATQNQSTKEPIEERASTINVEKHCFVPIILITLLSMLLIGGYLLFTFDRLHSFNYKYATKQLEYVTADVKHKDFIHRIRFAYALIMFIFTVILLFAVYYHSAECFVGAVDCSMVLCWLIPVIIGLDVIATLLFFENVRRNFRSKERFVNTKPNMLEKMAIDVSSVTSRLWEKYNALYDEAISEFQLMRQLKLQGWDVAVIAETFEIIREHLVKHKSITQDEFIRYPKGVQKLMRYLHDHYDMQYDKGYTIEQVHDLLKAEGWNEEAIQHFIVEVKSKFDKR